MNKLIGRLFLEFQLEQLFFLGVGFLCMMASILDWDWWFENRKIGYLVKAIGRRGAGIFYFLLGLGFAGYGVYSIYFL
ncbi:hypothetical protein EZV73_07660 [Acidaminobacter sp. JC074]|uniref:immunity 17 family protein n=1 Tax=Acidaminobacter sp. JC074 TaxID=2530199 RepID=UPI001F0FF8A7|nr:immunity 17 family protein [Acidaminobacter sp. JC074]MCH4887442.1 hypothetical protein [Acidaminobacter sp. JC074]